MKPVDRLLGSLTMYRLVVYVLAILAAWAVVAAFLGRLSSSPTQLVLSLGLLLGSAWATDRSLARYFRLPPNRESWLITSLILFLIVNPAHTVASAIALVLAAAVASASKYLLAANGKHLFNPAAFAAALLSLTNLQPVTWWVGSSWFWPVSLLLGLAVVRKVRRFPLWLAFATVAILLYTAQFVMDGQPVLSNLQHALLSSPFIFLSTIMLTEPATMPPRQGGQVLFGILVAGLYVEAPTLGPLAIYPEVALLLGNLYAYSISPKFRVRLQLKEVQRISDRVSHYTFVPDRPVRFQPGQYMEWTLAGVPYDSRGNRRTFTLASSPTEATVQLGVKFYEPASQFKATLAALQPGDAIFASQLAGNFTLPRSGTAKLAFIAGGIGITPFRSMIKYLVDNQIRRDVVLIYALSQPEEFAYAEVLRAAIPLGVRTIPVVTREGYTQPGVVSGPLSSDLIARLVPDITERLVYISGPGVMVDATKHYLLALGVRPGRLKTDHFSGY